MKTIVTAISDHRPASGRALVARVPDFVELTKPRVMMLAVFTALVGLNSAPRELDPLHACLVVLAIAMGAAAAGVLNMWYDADIDAVMARTAMRPIPRGKVSRLEAIGLGSNARRGGSRAPGSRRKPGGCGAARRGYPFLCRCLYGLVEAVDAAQYRYRRRCRRAASGDRMDGGDRRRGRRAARPVPHHFSLDAAAFLGARGKPRGRVCTSRCADASGVSGKPATKRQNPDLQHSVGGGFGAARSIGFAGVVYGVTALLCGAVLIALALQLAGSRGESRRAASRLFAFSIVYLFALFAALLVDHTAPYNRGLSMRAARGAQSSRSGANSGEPASGGGAIRFTVGRRRRGMRYVWLFVVLTGAAALGRLH